MNRTYSDNDQNPQLPTRTSASPEVDMTKNQTRSAVTLACLNCRKAHLACDVNRPCARCIKAGKEDTCVDAQHRKRGRPRLHENRRSAARREATAYSFIMILSTSMRIARVEPDGAAALGYSAKDLQENLLSTFVQQTDTARLENLIECLLSAHERLKERRAVPASKREIMNADINSLAKMVEGSPTPIDIIRFEVGHDGTDTFEIRIWLGACYGATFTDAHSLSKTYIVASLRPIPRPSPMSYSSISLSMDPGRSYPSLVASRHAHIPSETSASGSPAPPSSSGRERSSSSASASVYDYQPQAGALQSSAYSNHSSDPSPDLPNSTPHYFSNSSYDGYQGSSHYDHRQYHFDDQMESPTPSAPLDAGQGELLGVSSTRMRADPYADDYPSSSNYQSFDPYMGPRDHHSTPQSSELGSYQRYPDQTYYGDNNTWSM